MRRLCATIVAAVLLGVSVSAETLTWDPNSESNLAGYTLYMRASTAAYDYNSPIAQIPVGTTTWTVTNPDPTKTWCFVLRAYNSANLFSADSNEACTTPTGGLNKPITPPRLAP